MVMALLIWMTIVFFRAKEQTTINRLLFLLLISLIVIIGTVFGPDAVYLLLN